VLCEHDELSRGSPESPCNTPRTAEAFPDVRYVVAATRKRGNLPRAVLLFPRPRHEPDVVESSVRRLFGDGRCVHWNRGTRDTRRRAVGCGITRVFREAVGEYDGFVRNPHPPRAMGRQKVSRTSRDARTSGRVRIPAPRGERCLLCDYGRPRVRSFPGGNKADMVSAPTIRYPSLGRMPLIWCGVPFGTRWCSMFQEQGNVNLRCPANTVIYARLTRPGARRTGRLPGQVPNSSVRQSRSRRPVLFDWAFHETCRWLSPQPARTSGHFHAHFYLARSLRSSTIRKVHGVGSSMLGHSSAGISLPEESAAACRSVSVDALYWRTAAAGLRLSLRKAPAIPRPSGLLAHLDN
jgi:hypothetical protein